MEPEIPVKTACGFVFLMSEKIIRDPVHDVIAFRDNDPLEAMLFRLLSAAEMQRLRRIRQLGMATLAYPGAEHSRYSHSLGVMETARKMLDHLSHSQRIDPEQRTLCLTAALLHDIGHGPFSHVFERVSGVHHESLTLKIINDPQSHVHRILAGHDSQLPAKVADCIECTGERTFIHDILCSQLDADRCDYLLRDSLHTGSRYGIFDLNWLIHALTIENNRLAVTTKGLSAVEGYLQARYHMYRNVYFHKVVRSSEGMLKLALHRARLLATQDRLDWPPRQHPVAKALLGQELSIAEFTDLDDVSILQCFKTWRHAGDIQLSRLCNGLLFRRLYKSIEVSHLDDAKIQEILAIATDVIQQAGGDPNFELFYDQPADTPYEIFSSNEILIWDESQLKEFAAVSPLVQVLNKQLFFKRIHVAENWRPMILKLLNEKIA
jgi:HD superfamily phosphohydrolase